MHRFITTVLALNIVSIIWLVLSAGMDPPDWKEPMHSASAALDNLKAKSTTDEIYITAAKAHFEAADTFAEIVISDFRRESRTLWILVFLNISGLSILLLTIKRKAPNDAL